MNKIKCFIILPFSANLGSRYWVGMIGLIVVQVLFGQFVLPTAILGLQ